MLLPRRSLAVLATVGCLPATALPVRHDVLPGPRLHLTAERGVEAGLTGLVSQWRDPDSGLALTQTNGALKPVLRTVAIGGQPALEFDGRDVLAGANGMPPGDYTKVVVAELDAPAAALLSGAWNHGFVVADAPFHGAEVHHFTPIASAWTAVPLGEPVVLTASHYAATGLTQIHQNGLLIGVGSGPTHVDSSLQLGFFGPDFYLSGKVAEVRLYDRMLSPGEQQQLYSELAQKYQIGADFPRVSFSELPAEGQLFPRGTSNTATVRVTGEVTSPNWETAQLEVLRNGQLWHFESQVLQYTNGEASFQLSTQIAVGLHNYDLRTYVERGGKRTLVAQRRNLVCGDAFLVQGQSNAVARDRHGEGLANLWASPWVRTFGSMGRSDLNDSHWDVADGENAFEHAAVGAWGLRLARNLVDEHRVPIAVLNGAQGATTIDEHIRSESLPEDPFTIYGRLLRRARLAGVAERARFLAWFQGESDFANANAYPRYFQALLHAWRDDYPALERTYVFQVRAGCHATGPGVREVQRKLSALPGVEVLSTTGLIGHDGCHFYTDGYRELGDRLARLVTRDVYGRGAPDGSESPNVVAAHLSADRRQVRLDFHVPTDKLVWTPGTELAFALSDGTQVVSGTAVGSSVVLDLASPSQAQTISLIDAPGDAPWIRTVLGVGALTFFDVAILP